MALIMNAFSAPSLELLSSDLVRRKTIIVTGASGGLGLEAARIYASLGAARLILAVRTQSKGEAAKASILSSLSQSESAASEFPHNNAPQIDVWLLDLASFASVQQFADKACNGPEYIDIALLNAAVSKSGFNGTQDGSDETLQTNLLSTVLLALRLLPKLRESSAKHGDWIARLRIVVARAHANVKEDALWLNAPNILDAFNQSDKLTRLGERYISSKLLLVWATRNIASLVEDLSGNPEVIVTYSCPGACQSDLAREWKTNLSTRILLLGIYKTIAKTAEEGARTLVLGTLLDRSKHGMFLKDKEVVA
jgi:retinol dehydrogenase-12